MKPTITITKPQLEVAIAELEFAIRLQYARQSDSAAVAALAAAVVSADHIWNILIENMEITA